jgi:hypothetical protein
MAGLVPTGLQGSRFMTIGGSLDLTGHNRGLVYGPIEYGSLLNALGSRQDADVATDAPHDEAEPRERATPRGRRRGQPGLRELPSTWPSGRVAIPVWTNPKCVAALSGPAEAICDREFRAILSRDLEQQIGRFEDGARNP